MGLFSKVTDAEVLESIFYEYVDLLKDKDYPLSYVFEFHSNDGVDLIYKEKTTSRNLFLLRNKKRIALKQIDDQNTEIFYAERPCSRIVTDDFKIVKIIHELYFEEFEP